MKETRQHRLIILAGPSCAGKSPLVKALGLFYPGLKKPLQPLVLYNSRNARPGEMDGVDYHFRSRDEIEKLKRDDHFVVLDVRGDLQAVDLQRLSDDLERGSVFFEGNPFIGRLLQTHSGLKRISRLSVFMSPLSGEEILFLKSVEPGIDLSGLVTDVMRRRLLRRTRKQKGSFCKKIWKTLKGGLQALTGSFRKPIFFNMSSPTTTERTVRTGMLSISRLVMT